MRQGRGFGGAIVSGAYGTVDPGKCHSTRGSTREQGGPGSPRVSARRAPGRLRQQTSRASGAAADLLVPEWHRRLAESRGRAQGRVRCRSAELEQRVANVVEKRSCWPGMATTRRRKRRGSASSLQHSASPDSRRTRGSCSPCRNSEGLRNGVGARPQESGFVRLIGTHAVGQDRTISTVCFSPCLLRPHERCPVVGVSRGSPCKAVNHFMSPRLLPRLRMARPSFVAAGCRLWTGGHSSAAWRAVLSPLLSVPAPNGRR
jgi:hypothetical protein